MPVAMSLAMTFCLRSNTTERAHTSIQTGLDRRVALGCCDRVLVPDPFSLGSTFSDPPRLTPSFSDTSQDPPFSYGSSYQSSVTGSDIVPSVLVPVDELPTQLVPVLPAVTLSPPIDVSVPVHTPSIPPLEPTAQPVVLSHIETNVLAPVAVHSTEPTQLLRMNPEWMIPTGTDTTTVGDKDMLSEGESFEEVLHEIDSTCSIDLTLPDDDNPLLPMIVVNMTGPATFRRVRLLKIQGP